MGKNGINTFSEHIEDYTVLNLLGKGGFASVYKAKCLKTGIFVAIKMIDKKQMHAAGMVDRVQQEVTIHYRLKHPSILELYTFFEDANYVYLVLELCHNGELQKFLKTNTENHCLSEIEASNVIRQVVEGLQYLHSHNILHRDMSLSNLLLTQDMQVKIADFGLATQLTRPDEKHMTMCGTPNFISPEVASRGSHGLEADVWGIGCLLYTLLVGRPPFDTQAVKSTLTRVVMAKYDLPAHLSMEAKDLINALLQKNPKDRLKLVQILDHSFIKRSTLANGMTSNLTHDSGIHTMSSRRDSAFSDFGYKNTNHLQPIRRSASDLFPSNNESHPTFLPNSASSHSVDRFERLCYQNNQRPQSATPLTGNFYASANSGHDQRQFSAGASSLNAPLRDKCGSSNGGSLNRHFGNNNEEVLRDTGQFYANQQAPSPPVDDLNGILQTVHTSIANSQAQSQSTRNVFTSYQQSTENPKPRTKGPIKLIAHRLLPTRHQTNNAVLSILDGGEVCIEFIKKRGMVCEVCRISADGQRVVLYEPDNGRGVPPSSQPPELPLQGTDQIFSFESLPEKHWKKYMYAYKFVELVRAKTPKITFYTDKAKCLLMENLVGFEACFYEGGKVTQSAGDGITLIDAHGRRVNVQSAEQCKDLTGGMAILWAHADESRNHCVLLERTLTQLPGQCNFPIIVGRRPLNINKENTPAPISLDTFSGTNIVMPRELTSGSSSSREKKVSVPGIGVATQLTSGEVMVRFLDGTKLWVDGKHRVKYQYGDGEVVKFTDSEVIPRAIIEKMQHMPKVLAQLQPPSFKHRNLRT